MIIWIEHMKFKLSDLITIIIITFCALILICGLFGLFIFESNNEPNLQEYKQSQCTSYGIDEEGDVYNGIMAGVVSRPPMRFSN